VLVDFQQALADLTASPDLCNAVRSDAQLLWESYALTDREQARLVAIVHHPGMAAACMVYRMNRIAPLAMNLRASMHALGPRLRALVSEYWQVHPHGHAHFYLEAARFGEWLQERIDGHEPVSPEFLRQLERERAAVHAALAASYDGVPIDESADVTAAVADLE
jgi:hypothetical protein